MLPPKGKSFTAYEVTWEGRDAGGDPKIRRAFFLSYEEAWKASRFSGPSLSIRRRRAVRDGKGSIYVGASDEPAHFA